MSASEPRVAGTVVLYRLFDVGYEIAVILLIAIEIVLALVQSGH